MLLFLFSAFLLALKMIIPTYLWMEQNELNLFTWHNSRRRKVLCGQELPQKVSSHLSRDLLLKQSIKLLLCLRSEYTFYLGYVKLENIMQHFPFMLLVVVFWIKCKEVNKQCRAFECGWPVPRTVQHKQDRWTQFQKKQAPTA